MKISLFSLPALTPGKQNVKDARLDQVDAFVKAKKKTYVQVEFVGEEGALDADVILCLKDARMDLILKDLEFVETRLGRAPLEPEKVVLNKLKAALEKEEFLRSIDLSDEEKQLISGYGLYTMKPVVVVSEAEIEDVNQLLLKILQESDCMSFFTVGEKETRAWLIKKGASAWEASGAIHSDIQKGFIRAEIISFNDYMQAGGEIPAKQAGKQRLEQKDYVMQDCDLANFRFNK